MFYVITIEEGMHVLYINLIQTTAVSNAMVRPYYAQAGNSARFLMDLIQAKIGKELIK